MPRPLDACAHKSIEPTVAVVGAAQVWVKRRSLLHLVDQTVCPDEVVLAKVRELVMAAIDAQRKIGAWIAVDAGFVS